MSKLSKVDQDAIQALKDHIDKLTDLRDNPPLYLRHQGTHEDLDVWVESHQRLINACTEAIFVIKQTNQSD